MTWRLKCWQLRVKGNVEAAEACVCLSLALRVCCCKGHVLCLPPSPVTESGLRICASGLPDLDAA